jgi:hypothetical protein
MIRAEEKETYGVPTISTLLHGRGIFKGMPMGNLQGAGILRAAAAILQRDTNYTTYGSLDLTPDNSGFCSTG